MMFKGLGRRGKRAAALVLALVFAVTSIIFSGADPAFALEFSVDKDGNRFAEDKDSGYYFLVPAGQEYGDTCILYVYGGKKTDLVLPTMCNSYKVTTVGSSFSSMVAYVGVEGQSLTTVTIPWGYTTIESGDGGKSGAFQNQKNLYRVEIPDSVTEIGKDAFSGCDFSKLTIVAPDGSYARKYAKKYGINNTDSTKVAIDPKGKTMYVGKKKTVRVYNNNAKIVWRSSKPSVAKISSDGVITAKKAGKTKITAVIKGKKYRFTLTVKKAKKSAAAPQSVSGRKSAPDQDGGNASAVSEEPSLRQTAATDSSFQVTWEPTAGASGYEVEVKDASGSTVSDTTVLPEYTFAQNVMPAAHYTVRVRPKGGVTWNEIDAVTVPKYKKNESKLVQKKSGASATSISLGWTDCEGADGFRILYWKEGETKEQAKSVDVTGALQCQLTELAEDSRYNIRVYPYCKSLSETPFVAVDQRAYATGKNIPVVPLKIGDIELEEFFTYTGLAKLSWEKSGAAAGYQWEILDGDKKTDGGSGKENSVTTTKMQMNKFYRVRARGYINIGDGKKYGEWSEWQYVSSQPKTITYRQSAGSLALTWSKVSGATSYTVYVSSKKPEDISDMKKVKTVKGNTYTVKKLDGRSIERNRRYYIVIVANKETDGGTYHSISKSIYLTR